MKKLALGVWLLAASGVGLADDTARAQLKADITAADARLFQGLNDGKIGPLKDGFSPRLEFYHDQSGVTNYDQNIAIFEQTFSKPTHPRRIVLPETVEVFPRRPEPCDAHRPAPVLQQAFPGRAGKLQHLSLLDGLGTRRWAMEIIARTELRSLITQGSAWFGCRTRSAGAVHGRFRIVCRGPDGNGGVAGMRTSREKRCVTVRHYHRKHGSSQADAKIHPQPGQEWS